MSRYLEQADLSPHDARARRELRRAARPDRDRRRQGPALGRDAGAASRSSSAGVTVVSLAKRLEEVFVPGRSAPLGLPADSEALAAAAAGPRRGAPVRDRPPPRPPRQGDDRARCSTSCPGVGPARKRALLRHFGSPERLLDGEPRGARGGARGARQARPRDPRAAEQSGLMAARGTTERGRRRPDREAGRAGGDHRPLRGRQVGGDRRLRGRRLLLRRQPAAADDRRPRRALPPRGQRRASGPRSSPTCAAASTSTTCCRCSTSSRRAGWTSKVLFLEADEETLLDRYKETRRRHPLAPRAGGSSTGSAPSASCWRRCASAPTW